MRPLMLKLVGLTAAIAWMAPAQAGTICLGRTVVNAKGKEVPFTILTPELDLKDLLTSGFTVTTCDGPIDLARYRDNVCKTAATGNEAVQARFTQVLGVAPARLCAAAKLLAPASGG